MTRRCRWAGPQRVAGYRPDVRLEPLSVFHWSYDENGHVEAPGYTILSAYGSEEGIGYGEGRGTATGRIEGTVVWSNYPRRRTDGRMLPNLRGLITTQNGASILVELRGRTIFEGDEPGRQNLFWLVRVGSRELPLVERPRLHRRRSDLGDGGRHGDQRLRRYSRDAGIAPRGPHADLASLRPRWRDTSVSSSSSPAGKALGRL